MSSNDTQCKINIEIEENVNENNIICESNRVIGDILNKIELIQLDNTLTSCTEVEKPKHFLDENPIPPDYIISNLHVREHRSLDRNFERYDDRRLASGTIISSYEKFKDMPLCRLPKSLAWTQSLDSRYSNEVVVDKLDKLGCKVECVYSLLSMLGSNDSLEMSKKFYELSRSSETCNTLRRSGCIPLLVQIIHTEGGTEEVQKWAGMALHNIVYSQSEEKASRREVKVLRLLDQIIDYCKFLRSLLQSGGEAIADDADRHPLSAISSLMKVSFDEEHRHAMCDLGALYAIPNLVHLDHAVHGPIPENHCCNSLRRFALMALTNLTFGEEKNKAMLCSQKCFMEALVAQLELAPDDLLQVTASVLRNLSWRADTQMKSILNEIGTVTALAKAAMKNKCENTLKAILSALWNLSAHCSTNKAEFCSVKGALSFIVQMLTYEGPSKTLKIIENAGGILRNVSSHIAVREEYRKILREYNCLAILLQQLKSESLTVVSNSCGTLWNLSARCPEDQKFLWDNGAVPMLRSLIHSKHAMISEGSACALKNLLNFRPSTQNPKRSDSITRSLNLRRFPSLNMKRTLDQQLSVTGKSHSETHDNITNLKDHRTYNTIAAERTPIHDEQIVRSTFLTRTENRDLVFSIKSDLVYGERFMNSNSTIDEMEKLQSIPTTEASFSVRHEVESVEEQPIDYSAKYNESVGRTLSDNQNIVQVDNTSNYQETDLDQPTDFSLRYAENQIGSDDTSVHTEEKNRITKDNDISEIESNISRSTNLSNENNEIPIVEDIVKCYHTEGTPYVISNAASISDLRVNVDVNKLDDTPRITVKSTPLSVTTRPSISSNVNAYPFGSYTPEKPVNYCEEGTPVYFSRYESLSSLEECATQAEEDSVHSLSFEKPENVNDVKKSNSSLDTTIEPTGEQNNSPLETPLMFSRGSSVESLSLDDIGPLDDKCSVVSEFSRLASGIISPSEIPDSPTQSMPQSPQNNNTAIVATFSPIIHRSSLNSSSNGCLLSVFADDLSTFHVENTPAQFSSATSLSNLSILDDYTSHFNIQPSINHQLSSSKDKISECEENENDANDGNDDDVLLVNCINMGMKRFQTNCRLVRHGREVENHEIVQDESKEYFTEDTLDSLVSPSNNFFDNRDLRIAVEKHRTSEEIKCSFNKQLLVEDITDNGKCTWQDDSLSSLSIESEDDTNLLNQAIAAGYSRSNSKICIKSVLPISQPMPIKIMSPEDNNLSTSFSKSSNQSIIQIESESCSSVDSSDSNDNQTNSLLELCIWSGMHKKIDNSIGEKQFSKPLPLQMSTSVKTNIQQKSTIMHAGDVDLKQNDVLPLRYKSVVTNRHLREREERDEKLLMECISTGIMKKIGGSQEQTSLIRDVLMSNNSQSKNVHTRSAIAAKIVNATGIKRNM